MVVNMDKYTYLIKWKPYTIEEDIKGDLYHSYNETIHEYFEDESKFLSRLNELDKFSGQYEKYKYCDGVEVEGYLCELRRII